MIAGSAPPLAGNRKRRKKEKAEERLEDLQLDQALADTFPASDTPALVSKGTISNPNPQEKRSGRPGKIRPEALN
jgi:hypothetical protein